MIVDDVKITVNGGELLPQELTAYIEHGRKKYPHNRIIGMDVRIDGEYADLKYYFDAVPFERIRRITGYLVGTLDRFNDAKRCEERERVKHNI